MTRAEFAKMTGNYWQHAFGTNEAVKITATFNQPQFKEYILAIADVATNGFDAELQQTQILGTWKTEPGVDTTRQMYPCSGDYGQCQVMIYVDYESLSHEAGGKLHNCISSYRREIAQEAAKRSRPFVGSHKLPYDSDWD